MNQPVVSILDPHVHFWHPRDTPRAVSPLVRALGFSPRLVDWTARRVFPRHAMNFFASPEYITRPYLPASLDEDRAHHRVDGVVHVEAGWEGKGPLGPVGETRWLSALEAAGACRVAAIVAHVDLSLGAAVAADVLRAHLAESDRVRSVRHTTSWHPSPLVFSGASGPGLMGQADWRRAFEQVARHGLGFDATVYGDQLDELSDLAAAFPEQRIALCHMGTPVGVGGAFGGVGQTPAERDDIRRRWRASMTRLAEHSNVFVKLSGLAMPVCGFGWEHRQERPSADEIIAALAPLIEFVIDTFGAERCMFASNFPIDKVSVSYAHLFDAYVALAQRRTQAERDALLRGTAAAFYDIA